MVFETLCPQDFFEVSWLKPIISSFDLTFLHVGTCVPNEGPSDQTYQKLQL